MKPLRILYVARHNNGGNNDEISIANALTKQGHEVIRLYEQEGHRAMKIRANLLLFHKWHDPTTLKYVRMPKVFWYFDLVQWPDETLTHRNNNRLQWMTDIIPNIDLGFCTDGDWVEAYTRLDSSKLVWLPQGIDSTYLVKGPLVRAYSPTDLLFTGIGRNAGVERVRFVEEMKLRYGDQFHHVQNGVYGVELCDLVASAKIVVAPIAPVTDRYWSNRVYLMLGRGAFLMHPYSYGLKKSFAQGVDLCYYFSMEHLHEIISYYLKWPQERKRIAEHGFQTMHNHTYDVRCATLIQTVRDTLRI
jgi:hypothetical protein